MKVVVIAKYGLQITTPKKTVNIAKGDKFDLYGKVFLYDGVIIDITQYMEVFEVVKDPAPAWPMTFEFTAPLIVTKPDGSKVTFEKGLQFKAVSDIVFIMGIALDIAKYSYCIKYVPEPGPEPDPRKDAELSWPEASIEVTDKSQFTQQNLSNPNNLEVAYESTNPEVATIDEQGIVTLVANGTTQIKAIFAGNDEFKEQTVAYELIVNDAKEAFIDDLIKDGGDLQMPDDIQVAGTLEVTKDSTIDLNGHALTSEAIILNVAQGATLTLTGAGSIAGLAKQPAIYVSGKLIIDSADIEVSSNHLGIVAQPGGEIVVNNGTFNAVEGVLGALNSNAKVTVNDGEFNCSDNGVIMMNGNAGNDHNEITINGGTFNGKIKTAGYIACGIYACNNDIVNVNAGEFNIENGCGILARAGIVNIGANVVINTTGTGTGMVGDSNVQVPCSAVVFDESANYPGLTPEAKITIENGATLTSANNEPVKYLGNGTPESRIDDKRAA
jgi:hypothetical protein